MTSVDETNLKVGVDVDLSKLSQTLDLFKELDQLTGNISDSMQKSMGLVDRFGSTMSGLTQSVKENASGMREAYSSTVEDSIRNLDKLEDKINDLPDSTDFTFDDSEVTGNLRRTHEKIDEFNKENPIVIKADTTRADNSVRDYLEKVRHEEESMPKTMPTPRPNKDAFSQWHEAFKKVNDDTNLFSSAADRAQEHADRFKSIVSGAAIAGLVSNGVINSWYALSNGIKSALKSGQDYDKEQQRMGATWLTLRGTPAKSRQMVNQINKYSMATGQDTDLVDELEQGFYHLHSNYGESNKMTSSMLNMVDAVGIGKQQALAARQDMVNGLSRGNANAGLLNQISEYFPMFREQLAKDMHTKVTKLTGMAKAGQISGAQVEKTFEYLGLDKYKEAADNMMKTMFGMQRTISSQLPRLMGAMEKPIFKAQSPIYEALSKWVTSSKTTGLFKAEGKAIAGVFDSIIKLFPALNNTKSATNLLNHAMKGLIHYTKEFGVWIRDNPTKIKAFGSSIAEMTKTGFDVLIDSLKILDVLLKPLSKFATAHPKQFADIAAGYIVVTRAVSGLTTAIGLLIKAGGGVRSALNIGNVVTRSILGTGGKHFAEDDLLGDRIVNGVKSSAKKGNLISGAGKFVKNLFTNGGRLGKSADEVEVGEHAASLGRFGRIASMGARRIPILGTALSATELIGMNKRNRAHKVGGFVGNVGGGIGGAAAGAAIGSVIPGVGTAIGAGVGGVVGSLGGSALGHKIGDLVEKNFRHSNSPIRKTITDWGRNIGKWTKSALNGIGKFFTGGFKWEKSISEAFSGIVKNVKKIWSPIGRTLEKPLDFIVGVTVRIGQSLRKPFQQAVKAIKGFFSDLGSWFSKLWSGIEKTASHVWQGIGNLAKGAWNVIVKAFSPLVKLVGGAFQTVGKIAGTTWNGIKQLWGGAYHFFAGVFAPVGKFVGGVFHGIGNIAQSVWKNISNIFGNIGKEIGKIGDIIKKSPIGKFVGGIGKWIHQTTQLGHRTIHGHAVGGTITKSEIGMVGEEGAELRDHNGALSLIGTHGKTLMPLSTGDKIYTNSQLKSLLNRNGEIELNGFAKGTGATLSRKITINTSAIGKSIDKYLRSIEKRVSSIGSSMLKAEKSSLSSQTKSILSDISKLTKKISNSFSTQKVKITGKVSPSLTKSLNQLKKALDVKSFEKLLNKIDSNIDSFIKSESKSFVQFVNSFENTLSKGFNSIYSKSDKQLNKIQKDWNSTFNDMQKSQESSVNSMNKYFSSKLSDSLRDYEKFGKNLSSNSDSVEKQWKSNWSDMSSDFKDEMNKLPNYAKNSMEDVVSNLNRGTSSINKLLAKFGGNSSVLPAIHYAKGTMNGRIAYPHIGILNDAPSGERQEAILRGDHVLYPKGNNAMVPLMTNDIILNGEQTKEATESGLIPHYKKGTISQKLADALSKTISHRNDKPKAYFKNDYIDPMGSGNSMNGLGKSLFNVSLNVTNKYGRPWYGEAMKLLNNAIGSDDATGSKGAFLRYAEEHFTGKPYLMGGTGPRDYDCSGMVMTALKHFGINIGRTTTAMAASHGTKYLGKDLSKTVPGDLVIYGHGNGANGHVGIIKNTHTHSMFNETPPKARVTSIDTPKSMGYGYYSIDGLSSKPKKGAIHYAKGLKGIVQKELASQISWLKKYVAPKEDEDVGDLNLTGDIGARARKLAQALKRMYPSATKAGIAAVLGNWEFESHLDPSITNSSGGASGLGQWLGGRLSSLKSYAKSHGKSWKDAALQLSFALHGDGSDSSLLKSVLRGSGSVSSLASKFSTDWERGGYTAQHVNGAKEVEGALKRFAHGGKVVEPTLGLIGENKGQSEWVINPKTDESDGLISEVSSARAQVKGTSSKAEKPTVVVNNTWHFNGTTNSKQLVNAYKKHIKPSEQKIINEAIEKYFNDMNSNTEVEEV